MSRTENIELTVLCLIEDGDRVLLQNRTKKDWQGYAFLILIKDCLRYAGC